MDQGTAQIVVSIITVLGGIFGAVITGIFAVRAAGLTRQSTSPISPSLSIKRHKLIHGMIGVGFLTFMLGFLLGLPSNNFNFFGLGQPSVVGVLPLSLDPGLVSGILCPLSFGLGAATAQQDSPSRVGGSTFLHLVLLMPLLFTVLFVCSLLACGLGLAVNSLNFGYAPGDIIVVLGSIDSGFIGGILCTVAFAFGITVYRGGWLS